MWIWFSAFLYLPINLYKCGDVLELAEALLCQKYYIEYTVYSIFNQTELWLSFYLEYIEYRWLL